MPNGKHLTSPSTLVPGAFDTIPVSWHPAAIMFQFDLPKRAPAELKNIMVRAFHDLRVWQMYVTKARKELPLDGIASLAGATPRRSSGVFRNGPCSISL